MVSYTGSVKHSFKKSQLQDTGMKRSLKLLTSKRHILQDNKRDNYNNNKNSQSCIKYNKFMIWKVRKQKIFRFRNSPAKLWSLFQTVHCCHQPGQLGSFALSSAAAGTQLTDKQTDRGQVSSELSSYLRGRIESWGRRGSARDPRTH